MHPRLPLPNGESRFPNQLNDILDWRTRFAERMFEAHESAGIVEVPVHWEELWHAGTRKH